MGVWTPGPGPTTGNDTFVGDVAVDVVSGGDGDDILSGGGGNDTLNGDAGNDTLQGGAGADIVSGGEGDDVLVVATTDGVNTGETLSGGDGVDTLRLTGGQPGVGAGIALLNAQVTGIERVAFVTNGLVTANFSTAQLSGLNTATIVGSANVDTLQFVAFGAGTYSLATTAFTFENWDNGQNLGAANFESFIRPGDTLALAAVLQANAPANFNLTGSSGRDSIFGNSYNDVINGGDGNDILVGGLGVDQLFGDAGDDAIVVAGGVLPGNNFNSDEDYSLETYDGGAGRDFLTAVGTVTFNGTLTSFEGFAFGTSFDSDLTIPWSTVSLMPADVHVIGSDFATKLIITASSASVINLSQWRFANAYWTDTRDLIGVVGSDGADQITGTIRTDYIAAGLGDDIIDGGGGLDTAYYGFEAAGVTVNLSIVESQNTVGAGFDTLINIENIAGTDFDDRLTGNGGSNVLMGGAGSDILDGNSGVDTVSAADDLAGVTIHLAGGWGQDGSGTYDTLLNLENIIGSDFGDTLVGNELGNSIVGELGDDWIVGLGGDDLLEGGIGINVLIGGTGTDLASYASQTANLWVDMAAGVYSALGVWDVFFDSIEGVLGGSGNDAIFGNELDNTLRGAGGNDALIGGAGNDRLEGGAGSDWIVGGEGNDRLIGGEGVDVLTGGAGADTFDLGTAAGWDVAFDFNTAEDRLSLGGLSWLGFLTIDADGDGQADDTLLGYAGGNFVALNASGLGLTEWNALVDAPASADAGAKVTVEPEMASLLTDASDGWGLVG